MLTTRRARNIRFGVILGKTYAQLNYSVEHVAARTENFTKLCKRVTRRAHADEMIKMRMLKIRNMGE